MHGACKQYKVGTQNILQVSTNNGATWSLAQSHTTATGPWLPGQAGALACGNAEQTIASAVFGTNCSAVGTQADCTAPRCAWDGRHSCAWAGPPPPPPPPPPAPPGWPYGGSQAKFYGTNLLCELDAPNEFYLDEATQTVYFYPPTPLEQWTEGPYITQALFAVNVSGTSHITLRGLGIHHARGNGLLARNVTGVRVEDCEISGQYTYTQQRRAAINARAGGLSCNCLGCN